MSVHQCPRCELRYSWQTELDYHCREEHPEFHHDYVTHSEAELRGIREARVKTAQPAGDVAPKRGGS